MAVARPPSTGQDKDTWFSRSNSDSDSDSDSDSIPSVGRIEKVPEYPNI
jgi:hypothetical protein